MLNCTIEDLDDADKVGLSEATISEKSIDSFLARNLRPIWPDTAMKRVNGLAFHEELDRRGFELC